MKTLDTKQQILDEAGFSYNLIARIERQRKSSALNLLKITMRRYWNDTSVRIPAERDGSFISTTIRPKL